MVELPSGGKHIHVMVALVVVGLSVGVDVFMVLCVVLLRLTGLIGNEVEACVPCIVCRCQGSVKISVPKSSKMLPPW